MIVNLLAGAPESLLPDLQEYEEDGSVWVGVDKGVFTLLLKKLKPTIAFGDFDSVSEEEFHLLKKHVEQMNIFAPEKNETDMELALNWAVSQNPSKIRIFGGTGGRLDHFLANIQLLIGANQKNLSFPIEIIDRNNQIYAVSAGVHHLNKIDHKKYISFIPISQHIEDLTLTGFKYPLKNCHISLGSTLCISNELINNHGTFSFTSGILLVIRSSD
jgi:thiamine pyrophosphokinase